MTETRVKALPIAERDRRWSAIRTVMAERRLDALIIRGISSKWDGGTANIRYVSQIGGNGEEAMAVFPASGDPTIFIWASSQLDWWPIAQDWVKDVRLGSPSWAETCVARLRDLGLARGRIGVVGIGGRSEAGRCLSHDIYSGIRAGLPDAQFEPASDIFERLRLCKSPDEVACIAKATELCDLAVAAMLEAAARPGAKAYEVYAEILHAAFRAGGKSPMFLMYEADPAPRHALRFPSDRPLRPGYMILQEIMPKYAGYFSQVMVPVCVGEPDPVYRRLERAAVAAYDEALKAIRPGILTKEVADRLNRPIVEAGLTWTRPQWQGIGLENVEQPMDSHFPGRIGAADDYVLEEGMILGLQPMAALPDHSKGLQVGDTVVVTKDGVRRLGRTEMRMYVV